MMILSRRCRDYNTQGKKAEGKRSKRREEESAARARARARAERRAGFHTNAHLVVVAQHSPHKRREACPETSCQDSLQAWKLLLPSGRGCVRDRSATMHTHEHTHTQKTTNHPAQEKGFSLPLTICLCLFSQLLGWSFLCRTTWLLCSRLVRSYHAVEIMAFSRWRFLMICSWAACGERSCVSQQSAHQGSSLPRGSHGVLTCCSWVSISTPDPSTADIRMRMTSPELALTVTRYFSRRQDLERILWGHVV